MKNVTYTKTSNTGILSTQGNDWETGYKTNVSYNKGMKISFSLLVFQPENQENDYKKGEKEWLILAVSPIRRILLFITV